MIPHSIINNITGEETILEGTVTLIVKGKEITVPLDGLENLLTSLEN